MKAGCYVSKALGLWKATITCRKQLKVPSSDGWLNTGDILRCDENGWYFFVDRADDMFVCAGENIYPGDVESMLERNEEVMQAVVVPAPNVEGPRSIAWIVKTRDLR